MRTRSETRLTALLLLPLLLSVSGCAGSGLLGTTDKAVLTDLGCAGWRMIDLSTKDQLTPMTEDQIIAHNEYGERRGCWKAPKN